MTDKWWSLTFIYGRVFSRALALRLLVLVLTTAISAGLAEAMFRWHVRRTFDAEFPPWTENLVAVPGPQVFEFKPDASGVFPGNVDANHTFAYRTNRQGLRDRDRFEKKPGAKRVLVMGDSYTWGYAVAEDEAFPQTAERLLKQRGYPDIEVINGGVPDYNTRQERQLLERLMPVYRPDAVFVAYVVNDAEPSTAMPTPPEETYRHATSWFLAELEEVANRRLFKSSVFQPKKDTVDGNYANGFAEGSLKWRDSKQAIREMREMCAAARIPFAVLILPDFTQNFDDRYIWRPIHEAVASWGREMGFPVFDLLIPFRGEDHVSLWVPWDGHPNAEAHRRIAELLVARILEDPRFARRSRLESKRWSGPEERPRESLEPIRICSRNSLENAKACAIIGLLASRVSHCTLAGFDVVEGGFHACFAQECDRAPGARIVGPW